MGARPRYSTQTLNTNFPSSYSFIGFHGTSSDSAPLSLGYVIFYVDACDTNEALLPSPGTPTDPEPIEEEKPLTTTPDSENKQKVNTGLLIAFLVSAFVLSVAIFACVYLKNSKKSLALKRDEAAELNIFDQTRDDLHHNSSFGRNESILSSHDVRLTSLKKF